MIRTFKSKALAALWFKGSAAKMDARFVERITRRLATLNRVTTPEEMNVPGFNFHQLSGRRIGTYSIHVNGPWCLTFQWEGQDAMDIDLGNYH